MFAKITLPRPSPCSGFSLTQIWPSTKTPEEKVEFLHVTGAFIRATKKEEAHTLSLTAEAAAFKDVETPVTKATEAALKNRLSVTSKDTVAQRIDR